MRQGYRSQFPTGEFLVIEAAGIPIGRMVIDRTAAEIRVVDLALLPAHRNQGIGTRLLRQICAEADRPVHLSVLKFNRAAHWYERLGFTKISEQGLYNELEWQPVDRRALPSGAPFLSDNAAGGFNLERMKHFNGLSHRPDLPGRRGGHGAGYQ
jgi:GNAT superfamily N-acetyltransferase